MQISLNFYRIFQVSSQLFTLTKTIYQNPSIGDEEIDSMLAMNVQLQSEVNEIRNLVDYRRQAMMYQKQMFSCPESPNGANPYPSVHYEEETQQNHCPQTITQSSPPPAITPKAKSHIKSHYANTIGNNNNPKASPTYINLTEKLIKSQNKKIKKSSSPNRVCLNCKTTDTPEWRRGPQGAKTLCNACGIRYRLSKQKSTESVPVFLASAPVPSQAQQQQQSLPVVQCLPVNLNGSTTSPQQSCPEMYNNIQSIVQEDLSHEAPHQSISCSNDPFSMLHADQSLLYTATE
ncbi:hypothetical protein SAMD00019534_100140 [Acytostelium subglobosum LB1]|uniref:hypothetical protein n=1 Tax=Acytostelium subglobosum LB1 TaxID=1410327 RepID=UPI000644EE62|nr:hypothetical protein SAMD00019534_100140 [Acytostelium subglobosum LB1]GAM26839.1 hypothetical protein SAMD00019534_100140 [Acytostelium subglobosum LB1]|eukprot:XP_012750107.1 hypothetical protein SAMD00019534_100140 [Acytostelium subglobosum LB1]